MNWVPLIELINWRKGREVILTFLNLQSLSLLKTLCGCRDRIWGDTEGGRRRGNWQPPSLPLLCLFCESVTLNMVLLNMDRLGFQHRRLVWGRDMLNPIYSNIILSHLYPYFFCKTALGNVEFQFPAASTVMIAVENSWWGCTNSRRNTDFPIFASGSLDQFVFFHLGAYSF